MWEPGKSSVGPEEDSLFADQILLEQMSCLCAGQALASVGSVSSLKWPVSFGVSGQLSGEQTESASWKYGVALNSGQPLLWVS